MFYFLDRESVLFSCTFEGVLSSQPYFEWLRGSSFCISEMYSNLFLLIVEGKSELKE